jgi:hypothetical protein
LHLCRTAYGAALELLQSIPQFIKENAVGIYYSSITLASQETVTRPFYKNKP